MVLAIIAFGLYLIITISRASAENFSGSSSSTSMSDDELDEDGANCLANSVYPKFIMFHLPSCPACVQTLPAFLALRDQVKQTGDAVDGKTVAVCAANLKNPKSSPLYNALGATHVPYLVLIRNAGDKKGVVFDGNRSPAAMLAFLKSNL
jgi:hypothetical protein